MKKLLFLTVIALLAVQTVSADDVVTRDESKLPAKAKTFLTKYFTDSSISYIKIDKEFMQGKTYEVVMTDGVDIDFDSKGEWTEIDFKRKEVPAVLIPKYAKDYVATNFSGKFITKIERDKKGLEVELNDDLSVKFDKKGNFVRLDD